MNYIEQNLEQVREKIAEAAVRSGRTAEDITMIAVTKTIDADRINLALEAGVGSIGENRVQELRDKLPQIKYAPDIHFIGQLQSNKVKYILDDVCLIHSVDKLELAQEIERKAAQKARTVHALVEINIGDEASKGGIKPQEAKAFIERLSDFPHLVVQGIMTVAPIVDVPENAGVYFERMRELFSQLHGVGRQDFEMRYLSMGMSGDYEQAILHGSNMVRIGTAIFGNR